MTIDKLSDKELKIVRALRNHLRSHRGIKNGDIVIVLPIKIKVKVCGFMTIDKSRISFFKHYWGSKHKVILPPKFKLVLVLFPKGNTLFEYPLCDKCIKRIPRDEQKREKRDFREKRKKILKDSELYPKEIKEWD